MKPLKLVALVIGGLVALVVLALVAVLVLVDPNDYRGEIERRAQEATGRKLTIAGDIALSLFPWIALDVGRVELGNPAGFGGGPFLKAERMRVGAKLIPLLSRRLEVRRVAIDGLEVALVTRADGTNNWSDLAKSDATAPADAGAPAVEQATIAGIDVTRATISIADEAGRSLTRVRDLELHTGALGTARPTKVELAAVVDSGDGTPATRLKLATDATVDTEKSVATLAALQIEGERRAADAKSTPFTVQSRKVVLDWNTGALPATLLEIRWGSVPVSLEVSGEQLFDERLLTGRLRVPDFSPRELAPSLGVSLPKTRDANAYSKLSAAGNFRMTKNSLAFDALDVAFDRSRLKGRLAIEDLERLALAFDLSLDAIDVDAYRAPPVAAATPAAAAPPAKLPVEALRALHARGRLAIGRATLAALPLTDLRVQVEAADGRVRLVPSAAVLGGRYDGEIRLNAQKPALAVDLVQSVRGIDVGAAIKAYAKSDKLSGRASAKATLSGAGETDAALLAALTGPITVDVVDGALEGMDLTYELRRAQALFRRQAVPERTGAERTRFETLSATSRLADGVLASDPIRMVTDVLQVTGKGTFRLQDQAVDYRLTAVVQEVPPTGADASLAELRSLQVPLSITGTVQDYKVRPDVSGLAKARVKQEVEKRGEELKKKATDKLRDRLKGLFGGKEETPP